MLALVLGAPPAAATEVTFRQPAQAGGTFVTDASWVFLTFDEQQVAEGVVPNAAGSYVNHTWSETGEAHVGFVDVGGRPDTSDAPAMNLDTSLDIALGRQGPAGLYIQANRIEITADVELADVRGHQANDCLGSIFDPAILTHKVVRPDVRCPESRGLGFVSQSGSDFEIRASGLHAMEWHNAEVICAESGDCPDGGPRIEQTMAAGDLSIVNRQFSYDVVTLQSGEARLGGRAATVAWGGASLDVALAGWVRLPLASCIACEVPGNGTLWAKGNLELTSLQFDGQGLSGNLGGDIDAARFDERPIDPVVLGASGAAVAIVLVGGALFVKWVLAAFFTRLQPDRALEHPRRRQIYEYVGASPGATFRELVRSTGISHGVLRHHLTTLVRAGQVVERQYGNTIRLFHNHGSYDSNWQQVVGLRDERKAEIWHWLSSHPGAAQKDIINAMKLQHGWHPATTQHRLGRLVEAGVLDVRTHGRFRRYFPTGLSSSIVPKSASEGTAAGPDVT